MNTRRQIATRVTAIASGKAIPAGWATATARVQHISRSWGTNLRLVYGNPAGTDPYQVRATLETPAGRRVTFGGSATGTVPVKGFLVSDPVAVTVKPGQPFYTRTYTALTGTTAGDWQAIFDLSPDRAEWVVTGDATEPGTPGSGIASTGWNLRAPLQVQADAPASQVSILYGTDSIGQASLNPWTVRFADRVQVPWQAAGLGGEAMLYLPSVRAFRYGPDLTPFTIYVCQYGANDMAQTGASQAQYIEHWTWVANQGVKVIQSTVLPHTSGDASTLAGQTPNAEKEIKRVPFNTWLRDGAPMVSGAAVAPGTSGALRAGQAGHPLWKVADAAAQVESSLNSGKWRVDQGNISGDGLHPAAKAHELIAAGLPSNLFAA